jgi:hypothetical protein
MSLALPISLRVTAVAQPPYDARLARSGSGGPRHSRSCAANGRQRNLRPTMMTPLLPSAQVAVFLLKQPQLCLICFVWTGMRSGTRRRLRPPAPFASS